MSISTASILVTSLFLSLVVAMPGAMPWMGPMPTPKNLMASTGMSPRPTTAPGAHIVPQELRRRQNVQYPPPNNWCGFVDGDYANPLSCGAGLTCVHSESAMGCCTATTGICTALYTACLNSFDNCDKACQQNPAIIKCSDVAQPFCGTYAFPSGISLYNCDSTTALAYSVEFLNDYYVTAIGSTLASETTNDAVTLPSTVADNSATATGYTPISTPSSYYTSSSSSGGGGLSPAAIDGIAAAAAVIGVAIFALLAFCCVRQRRKRRMARPTAPYQNAQQQAPMQQQTPVMQQQQQQGVPPKAFGGYESVPQQEQPPQYGQYPPPQQPPPQQSQTGYFPPPGAPSTLAPSASAISPMHTGTTNADPRFSTANTSMLSPISDKASEQRQSQYYRPPVSPTATEVDGTMGNPGIPSAGAHGRPSEVDSTMGNPGVPIGGHGIADQMQPGGSPSAAEIDGRHGMGMSGAGHGIGEDIPQGPTQGNSGMRAGLTRPYEEGPYEMGNEGGYGGR